MKTKLYHSLSGAALFSVISTLSFGCLEAASNVGQSGDTITTPYAAVVPVGAYQQLETNISILKKKISRETEQLKGARALEASKKEAANAATAAASANQELRLLKLKIARVSKNLESGSDSPAEIAKGNAELRKFSSQYAVAQEKAKEAFKISTEKETKLKEIEKTAPVAKGSFAALRKAKEELAQAELQASQLKKVIEQQTSPLPPPPAEWIQEPTGQGAMDNLPPPPAEWIQAPTGQGAIDNLPPPPAEWIQEPTGQGAGVIPPAPPLPGTVGVIPPAPPLPGSGVEIPSTREAQVKSTEGKHDKVSKRPSVDELLSGGAALKKTSNNTALEETTSDRSLISQSAILDAKANLKKKTINSSEKESSRSLGSGGLLDNMYAGMSKLIKPVLSPNSRNDADDSSTDSGWDTGPDDQDDEPTVILQTPVKQLITPDNDAKKMEKPDEISPIKSPADNVTPASASTNEDSDVYGSLKAALEKRRASVESEDGQEIDDTDWGDGVVEKTSLAAVNPSQETPIQEVRATQIKDREEDEEEEDEDDEEEEKWS